MSHFVHPGEGRLLANTGGADSLVRADSRPGDGRNFVVVEATMPAGFVGPPRHLHVSMDEFFYVLEGSVEVEIGDTREWVQAGGSGFMPRGVRHRVWGPGDNPCRVLSVMSPGIFHAMEEMAAAGGENGASDPSKILALMTKYETIQQPA